MFRNPRENASFPSPDAVLKPSIGRPPTPLSSSTSHHRQPPQSVTSSATPLMANAAPSSATGSAKKAVPSSVNSRVRPKPNSSILSFFKKTESPSKSSSKAGKEEDDGLFVKDFGAKTKERFLEDSTRTFDLPNDEPQDLAEGVTHGSRYNEHEGSMKRRKLGDFEVITEHDQGVQEEDPVLSPSANPATLKEGTSSIIAKGPSVPKRRTGFFADDSDSEDGSDAYEMSVEAPMPEDAQNDGASTAVVPIHDAASAIDANGVTKPGNSVEYPSLHQESTSFPEDEFEGMEDFEQDEFAEEGEEYIERRWMEEQRMIEEGLEDDSEEIDPTGIGHERRLAGSMTPDAGPANVCPICTASLSGVSEHEASAHVNGCLDGNPTPLPAPKPTLGKQDSKPDNPPPIAKRFQRAAIARPGQENPFNLGAAKQSSSAFSKLMSGHAEDAAWAAAAQNEMASRGRPAYERTCPFYKILPGLFICVDAFRYGAVQGCNAYFLSHFHSDHYIGLTSSWCHGPIFCSHVTANLVRQQLKVDPKWVVDLEFEEKTEVPNTQGVQVTMMPANHCPGSSLFLFEKALGYGRPQRVLHCGDFRACPAHVQHPLLRPETVDFISGKLVQQRIDVCYLDTTYLTPKYSFPSQEDVIESCGQMCVSLSKEHIDSSDAWEETMRERAGKGMVQFIRQNSDLVKQDQNDEPKPTSLSTAPSDQSRGRLLVIIGTYSIGKERICLGIARALDCKIYAPPQKQRICACLEDPELSSRLTTDPLEAQIHMQMLMEIRAETLQEYLNSFKPHFSRVVGFRPTGWNYRPPTSRFVENPAVSTVLNSDGWKSRFRMTDLVPQRGSTKEASCFGVPYSEHSSFRELTMFCCALRIGRVIPTVNVGSKKSRERMKSWIEKWEAEKRKTGLFKVEDNATSWS